jgi:hypothetical protein
MAAEEAVDAALLWACKCCGCASIRRPGALLCASCWPGEGSDVCEQTLHLRRLDYARQHGAPPSGLVALHVQQPLEQVMRDELRLSLMDQMISNTVGAHFHRTCGATYDLPSRSSSSSALAAKAVAHAEGLIRTDGKRPARTPPVVAHGFYSPRDVAPGEDLAKFADEAAFTTARGLNGTSADTAAGLHAAAAMDALSAALVEPPADAASSSAAMWRCIPNVGWREDVRGEPAKRSKAWRSAARRGVARSSAGRIDSASSCARSRSRSSAPPVQLCGSVHEVEISRRGVAV